MSDEQFQEVQLQLFKTELVWHEFPHEVRQQVSQLLTILCIEIVEEFESQQEQNVESRNLTILPLVPFT